MSEEECVKNYRKLNIPSHVRLIAVSKKKPISMISALYNEGHREFGENYIQEAIKKIEALKDFSEIKWHFMGKLQSNKAKMAAEYFDMVQSIDSIKLATRLNRFCGDLSKKMPILIQVNVGNEPQKAGIAVSEIETTLKAVSRLDNLIIEGLMCIPPFDKPSDPFFKQMKSIFETYREKYNLSVISMGMSGDYEKAIIAGSTMVRVGTKIFGTRN